MDKHNDLKKILEIKKNSYNEELKRFEKNFKDNPAYAFEWADNAIEASQALKVIARVLNAIEKKEVELVSIQRCMQEEVNNNAKWGTSKSTSPCTNIAKESYLKALADILEVVRQVSDYKEE